MLVRWNKWGEPKQETVAEEAQENDAVLNWMERRLQEVPPSIFLNFPPILPIFIHDINDFLKKYNLVSKHK